jgi:hypothetical protein
MARKTRKIRLRFKYAVLGDGQTEHYYFKHLKEIKDYKYSLRPSFFANISLHEAEQIIDELLNSGINKVIFITDYDTVVNQNTELQFNAFTRKYSSVKEVLILETMPSIEFWFLLHFQYTTHSFLNASEAEIVLKRHIPNYHKKVAYLKESRWVKELCSNDKMNIAVNNARKGLKRKNEGNIDSHFPFTNIHIGIEEFEIQKNKGEPNI